MTLRRLECGCADLDPARWHQQVHDWTGRRFMKAKAPSFWGVPLTYTRTRGRLRRKVEKQDAERGEMLLIQSAKFLPTMLLEARGAEKAKEPFGRVYTELVDAPWGKIGKLVTEAQGHALGRYGKLPRKVYLWYLSCGKCSNERGFPTLLVADLGRNK